MLREKVKWNKPAITPPLTGRPALVALAQVPRQKFSTSSAVCEKAPAVSLLADVKGWPSRCINWSRAEIVPVSKCTTNMSSNSSSSDCGSCHWNVLDEGCRGDQQGRPCMPNHARRDRRNAHTRCAPLLRAHTCDAYYYMITSIGPYAVLGSCAILCRERYVETPAEPWFMAIFYSTISISDIAIDGKTSAISQINQMNVLKYVNII